MATRNEKRGPGNPAIQQFFYKWLAAVEASGETTRHYSTEAARRSFLRILDQQLQAHGVHRLKPQNIRGRHVDMVVGDWREAIGRKRRGEKGGLSERTVKNRLSHFRWLAKAVGKEGLLPKSNAALDIPERDYVPTKSRAQSLSREALDRIPDPYVRVALRVQQALGLRREEALKTVWERADKGHDLDLKGSWCKNGRPRTVPITTADQRAAINAAKAMAKTTPKGSLVVDNYKAAKERYDNITQGAGLSNLHGLRHGYAQWRFEVLAGFPCPLAGGPLRSAMVPAQQAADKAARIRIAYELGHGQPGKPRPGITVTYLGGRR